MVDYLAGNIREFFSSWNAAISEYMMYFFVLSATGYSSRSLSKRRVSEWTLSPTGQVPSTLVTKYGQPSNEVMSNRCHALIYCGPSLWHSQIHYYRFHYNFTAVWISRLTGTGKWFCLEQPKSGRKKVITIDELHSTMCWVDLWHFE